MTTREYELTVEPHFVKNFWPGRDGYMPMALVEHMMQGTLEETERYFNGEEGEFYTSAHYGIGRDGRVWQFVRDEDTAWANGVLNRPDSSIDWLKEVYEEKVNPNLVTLAIEYEGYSGEALTEAQYEAALLLHRRLLQRWQIPADPSYILGHNRLDTVERTHNPGPAFPLERLLADLNRAATAPEPAYNEPVSEAAFAAPSAYAPEPEYAVAEPEYTNTLEEVDNLVPLPDFQVEPKDRLDEAELAATTPEAEPEMAAPEVTPAIFEEQAQPEEELELAEPAYLANQGEAEELPAEAASLPTQETEAVEQEAEPEETLTEVAPAAFDFQVAPEEVIEVAEPAAVAEPETIEMMTEASAQVEQESESVAVVADYTPELTTVPVEEAAVVMPELDEVRPVPQAEEPQPAPQPSEGLGLLSTEWEEEVFEAEPVFDLPANPVTAVSTESEAFGGEGTENEAPAVELDTHWVEEPPEIEPEMPPFMPKMPASAFRIETDTLEAQAETPGVEAEAFQSEIAAPEIADISPLDVFKLEAEAPQVEAEPAAIEPQYEAEPEVSQFESVVEASVPLIETEPETAAPEVEVAPEVTPPSNEAAPELEEAEPVLAESLVSEAEVEGPSQETTASEVEAETPVPETTVAGTKPTTLRDPLEELDDIIFDSDLPPYLQEEHLPSLNEAMAGNVELPDFDEFDNLFDEISGLNTSSSSSSAEVKPFEVEGAPRSSAPIAQPEAAAPAAPASPPPDDLSDYIPAEVSAGAISVELANIRKRPTYDPSSIMRTAIKGTRFNFDGYGEGPELQGSTRWYHIATKDGSGWIHSALVQLDRPFNPARDRKDI